MVQFRHHVLVSALALAACSNQPKVEITHNSGAVQTQSRSEPVFYNGKTYNLDYTFNNTTQAFDLRVSGMGSKQQKDAGDLASSALGHFACPTNRRAQLLSTPSYAGGVWAMAAKCG
jgi:hypothetical protein